MHIIKEIGYNNIDLEPKQVDYYLLMQIMVLLIVELQLVLLLILLMVVLNVPNKIMVLYQAFNTCNMII